MNMQNIPVPLNKGQQESRDAILRGLGFKWFVGQTKLVVIPSSIGGTESIVIHT